MNEMNALAQQQDRTKTQQKLNQEQDFLPKAALVNPKRRIPITPICLLHLIVLLSPRIR